MRTTKLIIVVVLLLMMIFTGCEEFTDNKSSTDNEKSTPSDNAFNNPNSQNQDTTLPSVTEPQQSDINSLKPDITEVRKTPTNGHYINEKFGFSLDFPLTWEGKYYIEDRDEGITVYHNTRGKLSKEYMNPQFFSILTYGNEETWNEYEKERNGDTFPCYKIGVINGIVFVTVEPSYFPYDTEIEEQKADAIEFEDMLKRVGEIQDTFKSFN